MKLADLDTVRYANIGAVNEIERLLNTGNEVSHLETLEAADGSGRILVLIYGVDAGGHDLLRRVSSPAPATAPEWARRAFTAWSYERLSNGSWEKT